MKESVNHPEHYNLHPSGVECIDVVEHMGFNLGNSVKYIWRADHKSETPIEDLQKAKWYISREIERLQAVKQTATVPAKGYWQRLKSVLRGFITKG